MRKSLILLPIMAISMLFVSCGTDSKKYTSYQCPMKCEGTKTYDKAGDCPVCGMKLEGVESK